jgi:tRNA-specific 2-thiouridylase
MNSKAFIAMSGGVDSSVAAYLAMQEGFSCIGVTMRLLPQKGDDISDAQAVAQRLGMPFQALDFTEEFQKEVMEDFNRCYEAGLTPNPCVVCNRRMKFGALLNAALQMGCDYVITGHYAQITEVDGRYLLKKAADTAKDQSYFLYSLTQHQLSHVRFPLGGLTKEQARQIAEEQGFLNARKRDSQDICFIPDGDYFAFLKEFTGKDYPAGNFLDQDGNVVGKHQGAVAYTRGQRKGLGLAMGRPVYVTSKDMERNTVTVGDNEMLFSTSLLANDWVFGPFDRLEAPLRCMAKARSRMAEQPATVYPEANGVCRIVFDEPQRALTTGQAVVLYDGDIVIGGGTITEIL